MNLTVSRYEFGQFGIFGILTDEAGEVVAQTLEHAYPDGKEGWAPKTPEGSYVCRRGAHRLHSGTIETFEVMGVPGRSGILFHPGNTEGDSEGCFLLGRERAGKALTDSRRTFSNFMDLQDGHEQFVLKVRRGNG